MRFVVIGIPYAKKKVRGYVKGPKDWATAILKQTKGLKVIDYPCIFEVRFILLANKFPSDLPFGPDLDNLLKHFLDCLQKTCLENDSLIIKLIASKSKIRKNEKPGAKVMVRSRDSSRR
ncbi:RusA family crossover junction endodeoxyribonuclease [Candidatus Margulisiibacteriota bacterium]